MLLTIIWKMNKLRKFNRRYKMRIVFLIMSINKDNRKINSRMLKMKEENQKDIYLIQIQVMQIKTSLRH